MYRIIGGDGKEYGPASAEQIRKWIAAGRASLDTRAKAEGGEDWQPLGEFPDFAPSPPSAEPPPLGPVGRPLYAQRQVVRLDPLECFSRSWGLFRENPWPTLGVTAVYGLLWMAATGALQRLMPHPADNTLSLDYLFSPDFLRIRAIVDVVYLLLLQPLGAGYFYYFVRRIRGEPTGLADLFGGFSRVYPSLLLAGIFVQVLEGVGFLCFILPGIYFMVAYALTPIAILDRKVGFWRGMEVSRQAIRGNWWAMLLVLFLSALLVVAGMLALLVGALVTVPLCFGAIACAYVELAAPVP